MSEFVQGCDICKMLGLLQPLPIPNQSWKDIFVDFIQGLPKSGGCDVIPVVVDRLTKYGYFLALTTHYIAKIVAKVFFE